MAVSKNVEINYNDYMATYGNAWIDSRSYWGGDTNTTFYVMAPSFRIRIQAQQAMFAGSYAHLEIYKWDGASSFNKWNSLTAYQEWLDYDNDYAEFLHNTYEQESAHSRVKDYSDIHLWKLNFWCDHAGNQGNAGAGYKLYFGGLGKVPNDSNFNHMWKRASEFLFSSCTSRSSNDSYIISNYSPGAFKGVEISTSNAYGSYSIK